MEIATRKTNSRRWTALAMAALLISAGVSTAVAGQPSDTEAALEKLERALSKDKSLDRSTRDALRGLVDALQAERSGGRTAAPVSASKADALDRLSVYGDIRLRQETNTNLDDQAERHRQRIRMRLGANYEVSDELTVGARLTTGSVGDPNSPHQTLGNVFDRFDVNLDRAFVKYKPNWAEGLWLTGGKFGHPFWQNPVYGELVWDADVQPEGVALGYTHGVGNGHVDIKAGEYVLREQSGGADASAFVAQVASHSSLNDQVSLSAAVGYYRYANLTADGDSTIIDDQGGSPINSVTGSDFTSGFEIVNPIVALTYGGLGRPLVLSGEYIVNDDANIDEDEGWAVGAAYGKAGSPGDYRLFYQYNEIEQDAVLANFAQDDFLMVSNHESHVFGVDYKWSKRVKPRLWALVSSRDQLGATATTDSDKEQWRLRADLNISF